MLQKFKEGFRKIDLFSQPVELYLRKETSHSTLFGAILSFGLIMLMSYLVFQQLKQMVEQSDPNIQITQIYTPSPERINFNFKNFTFSFGMENNSNFQTFLNESLIQTSLWAVHKYQIIDTNGQPIIHFQRERIPFVPCSMNLIGQDDLKQYFENYILPTQYCINYENITTLSLEGTFDSPDFRYFELNIGMCQNSSLSSSQPRCAQQEIIDKELAVAIFAFQISNTLVNLLEPVNPHQTIGKDIYTTVSNKMFKHIDLYLQAVETQTDNGYLFSDMVSIKSAQYSNHIEQLDFFQQPDMFLRMMIRLTPSKTFNKRKYLNLMDILGNAGGLWQVLFFIVYLIVKPVNELSQKLTLLNSLFNFEEQQTDCKEEEGFSGQNITTTLNKEKKSAQLSHLVKQLKTLTQLKKQDHINEEAPQLIKSQSNNNPILSFQSEYQNKRKPKQNANEINRRLHQQQQLLKEYFKKNSKKLILQTFDYFHLAFRCCSQKSLALKSKRDQIKFSSQKIVKSMDIVTLIKKVNEIDKLKMLLLSSEQIRMFDYVEKPTISTNPFIQQEVQQKYWSILKPKKMHFQSTVEAQKAYHNLSKDKNILNRKLISMLDENLIKFFEMQEEENIGIGEDVNPEESNRQYIDKPQIQLLNVYSQMKHQTNQQPPRSITDLELVQSDDITPIQQLGRLELKPKQVT